MPESRTHTGGCHCGAVRYRVTTDLTKLFDCNCSRCRRLGAVMAAVPGSAFVLLSGEEALVRYQFNRHVIDHLFCRHCGIQSFSRGKGADGSEGVVVNIGCLDGAPVIERPGVMRYDGAAA